MTVLPLCLAAQDHGWSAGIFSVANGGELRPVPRPARPPLPLRPDEQRALAVSIAENGVIYPVIVDEDGPIIDGYHRAAIATETGIEYPTQVIGGISDDEKYVMAVRLNVARRHLTDAQKVLLGQQIEPDLIEIARAKMAEGGQKSAPGKGRSHDQTFRTPEAELTRSTVAREVCIGSGITLPALQEGARPGAPGGA